MRTYLLSYRTPVYTTLEIKANDRAEAEQKAYDFAVHGEQDGVKGLSEEWYPHDFEVDECTDQGEEVTL